jgi:hypothetical protein
MGGIGGNGAFSQLTNAPGASLGTQAAVVALTGNLSTIGLMQTVNTLRFSELSINYDLPRAVSNVFRVPHMSVALQGKNLALRTNYFGKDPNVNASAVSGANGDRVSDSGQLPQPRTWGIQIIVGN